MKVKELIDKLKEHDLEDDVVVFNIVEEAYYEDVESVNTMIDPFDELRVVVIGFRNS